VCLATAKTVLFRQTLATLSQGSLLDGFDLAVCAECGGAYADDIPEQEAFDRYYAEMSKYEYSSSAGVPSETNRDRFRENAAWVEPHLRPEFRLLDVGCATGGLLAEFKARGFSHLLGVDPSPVCARLAQELHGIRALALTFNELEKLDEKADVVFLTGVLEHIRDIDAALEKIRGRLDPGGLLFVEVPDATRYDRHFSAPYQLLSMEHVNYFSPASLTFFLDRQGFTPIFTRRSDRYLTPQAVEPCVGGLFRLERSGASGLAGRDEETLPALQRYLEQCAALETRINAKVAELADSGVPLAVWGTGTHTLRLLKTSRLGEAKIVAFIDSNANYQTKELAGVKVLAPADFHDREAHILISTQPAEEEIWQTITQKLRWPNPVHRLYAA
jgi:SAM-dependent methyltransferase